MYFFYRLKKYIMPLLENSLISTIFLCLYLQIKINDAGWGKGGGVNGNTNLFSVDDKTILKRQFKVLIDCSIW